MLGVGTLARTGVSEEMAREAYDRLSTDIRFDDALAALGGVVRQNEAGRFFTRHEVYSRYVIENVAELDVTVDCVVGLLRFFTKFRAPIVKVVPRLDALLFKFLLNHNFAVDLCQRRNLSEYATRIYEPFEIDFQLDGHYWLQYGQAYVRLGELEPALRVLTKSIEAYPENDFAIHALADVQLRVAAQRKVYDAETVDLIASAVATLEEQHAKIDPRTDQYPIVTLADRHVGVLIKHDRTQEAKACAKKYFPEIEKLSKLYTDDYLDAVRQRLAHFLATDKWYELQLPQFNNH
jgi:tetratricopeptide (TPR) repeat protein